MQQQTSSLVQEISALTPLQRGEAERFLDTLQHGPQEGEARFSTAALSEASFAGVWENPEDDVYDAL